MAQHLPQELAVDRPLKLGATFTGNTTDGFLTFQYDFQPESMKRVAQGDLLFFGREQEQIKFVPELPEGDAPFHFEGPCRTLQQQDGEETECIAIFDGQEWTLQLVSARITAKHVRGTPQIPGYNVDLEDDLGIGSHHAATPAVGLVNSEAPAEHPNTAHDDIDPDLDDALEEALFAADNQEAHTHQQQQQQQQQLSAALAPPAQAQAVPQQQQHKQAVDHQVPQQQQQQHQQPVHAEDPEDSDDPWAEYSAPAVPAAPAASQQQSITVQTPAAPAAGVRVVSHEEDQDDEEEEAVHHCSEDESDGLGVEVF